MDDDTLLTLAAIEDHSAREEILKRHIMDVDEVEYERASETFEVVARRNSELLTSRAQSYRIAPQPLNCKPFASNDGSVEGYSYYMIALPYKVGIFSASMLGIVSLPMVFHLPTVEWFNEWAVTTDVPALRDLETPLEVSIWAWNWMEVRFLPNGQ